MCLFLDGRCEEEHCSSHYLYISSSFNSGYDSLCLLIVSVSSHDNLVHCMLFFAASSVSMGHQWVNNEMKVSGSAVNASGTHFVKDASGIRPQFKPDVHASASSHGPGKLTLRTFFCPHIIFQVIISWTNLLQFWYWMVEIFLGHLVDLIWVVA